MILFISITRADFVGPKNYAIFRQKIKIKIEANYEKPMEVDKILFMSEMSIYLFKF